MNQSSSTKNGKGGSPNEKTNALIMHNSMLVSQHMQECADKNRGQEAGNNELSSQMVRSAPRAAGGGTAGVFPSGYEQVRRRS